ncbi:MAG TPA: chemotaxis protein, partial [Verrucomicrobia bacterium]|nr:chemotaxis protein [Verrucomicrobiota bacterium]
MRLNDIKIGKKITIGNSVPVILVLVLAAVSVFGIKSLLVTNEMVDHTHVVIKEAMSIEAAAVDMETGMRGFLLAGEEGFLNPYKQGR